MPDGLVFIAMMVGFGLVIVAGARLGAGSPGALAGLFPPNGTRDWPIGVQEGDAPRFHLVPAAERTPAASNARGAPADDSSWAEIEELYAGPIR